MTPSEPNLIGTYGAWVAEIVGRKTGAFSLRSTRFSEVDAWRKQARESVWECLAPPELPATPEVSIDWTGTYEGLTIERLSWQLPYGPRTEAVFLKPQGVKEPLPAILALHDHGGMKYFGWRKIARIQPELHPILQEHQREGYGGFAWANEIAKRGYAVLVPDTFTFGSRRVKVSDVLPRIAGRGVDPSPDEPSEEIAAYNQWAGDHEHIMAKSLFSAGTTWPSLFLREDQVALSVLIARPDTLSERIGCGGLSGGGLRTVFLAGMDDRIQCCFCAGFMTTWRDLVLYKNYTHTWMTYVPLLPHDLDFPEILGLRAPKPTLVMHCTSDPLFTNAEVDVCQQILSDVYERAGAPEAFRLTCYEGAHKLDAPMQADAFDWLDRWLK